MTLKSKIELLKKNKLPTLLICDSQAVKNTDTADIETKGFCHYKATNGIKRHLCVDVLGTPFFVVCTPANISDDDGFIQIVKENLDFFIERVFVRKQGFDNIKPQQADVIASFQVKVVEETPTRCVGCVDKFGA